MVTIARRLVLLLLSVASIVGQAQNSEPAKRIYADASSSVVVLYVQNTSGEYVAQGSGFFVEGGKIVTNAHVADAGTVFVSLGPVRVRARTLATDLVNDLALLEIEGDVTVRPLALSRERPQPGDTVFAITNPEGLEHTISEGLVSGVRKFDGRDLIQVTAAISHGSSGGPVLNLAGEVIGVAVAMLRSGQSLNFAVPAEHVAALLHGGTSRTDSISTILDRTEALIKEQATNTYSADPDSPYQKTATSIAAMLQQALGRRIDEYDVAVRVADLASNSNSELAVQAAERAVQLRSTAQSQFLLANALTNSYFFEEDGNKKRALLERTEQAARTAVRLARTPSASMYYRLAYTLEDEGKCNDAIPFYRSGYAASEKTTADAWDAANARGLVRCFDSTGMRQESEQWFSTLIKSGKTNQWDWEDQAGRLAAQKRWKEAADDLLNAVTKGGDYNDVCKAGLFYENEDNDLALAASRACIEKATGQKDSDQLIARAHEVIAAVLVDRGVYSEALSHAKEATAIDSSNPQYFDTLAVALIRLQRPQEAISAETQALRLSDGKYAHMHFHLGNAYFDIENWALAEQSFEKAATLDSTDDAAAYNTALCLARQGYYRDAAKWYEETLRRNPNRSDKADLQSRIRSLRQ